jgi:hypothetical protein
VSECDQLLIGYYQLQIVFTAFGVVAGAGVTLLLAQVLQLNDVIRDLRAEVDALEELFAEADQ